MSVFLSSETGQIIFTYTDINLSEGDTILFKNSEYYIVKKRFNVDSNIMEYFIDKYYRSKI